MIKTITAVIMAAGVAMSGAAQAQAPTDLGEYRITTYCQYCNEEVGYQSASGERLDYGHVAMNDVPLGSKVSIDGEDFIVTDRVGVDNTVDIFIPSESGECHCNWLDYKKVYLINE